LCTSVTFFEVTAPVKLPPKSCLNQNLARSKIKSGISLMLLKLPLILHKFYELATHGHSKGARGLSVLLQITRIFTGISISPRLHWRQRRSRYTIHAGRNLPAKEFRYLWTVRVTAAVYWDFVRKPQLSHLI
jgi:hypothetical protein